MLSYLTTSFADHVRVREQFGFKINEAMWSFFKKIGIIDINNKPTALFGQPNQVYLKYRRAKGDTRIDEEILREGAEAMDRVRKRGVPLAEGFGEHTWQLEPKLDQEVRELYKDAKYCLWTEWDSKYLATIPNAIMVNSKSNDKVDYVYHPVSGERLTDDSLSIIQKLSKSFKNKKPQIQIVISDGLNARSLMDDGHLDAFLPSLFKSISAYPISVSQQPIVIRNGRVRAGYQIGEELFKDNTHEKHCILHIIGERPGTIHRNFSVYITVAASTDWKTTGKIDHNITRVISGISDTAYLPIDAAQETARIISELFQ